MQSSTITSTVPLASGAQGSVKTDRFIWTHTEEAHRKRRQAIIKSHPEVLRLCGPEPLTKYLVLAVLLLQVGVAYSLRYTSLSSPWFLTSAYVVGATANQNLFLAIHEISHNLAFKSLIANRLFAIVANLPIGLPYSAAFRPYHLTHHKSLGVDGLDTDLPTSLEAFLLDSVLGKAFFCTFQILFYAIRPMMVYHVPITRIHVLNILAQVTFDVLLVQFAGLPALLYLLLSSFLAGSLHPCAGHFIAEHYVFDQQAPIAGTPASLLAVPETYSYYGPLNALTYNVGLHNEHHDFPAIPWSRLPTLHEVAKDFYADLPRHDSWTLVIWNFIWDKEVGMSCRVKRERVGRNEGNWKVEELGAGGNDHFSPIS